MLPIINPGKIYSTVLFPRKQTKNIHYKKTNNKKTHKEMNQTFLFGGFNPFEKY